MAAVAMGAALLAAPASADPLDLRFPAGSSTEGYDAARALNAVADHEVVLLRADIDLDPANPLEVGTRDGGTASLDGCSFGVLEDVARVWLPVDDNHLLATVSVGGPPEHAANMTYCEYAPENLAEAALQPTALSIRGCFLALRFSVPTASHIIFNPLPASACGLHK